MSQRKAVTAKILDTKRTRKLTWQKVAAEVAPDLSVVFVTAALLGQMPLNEEEAARAAALFDLDANEQAILTEPPLRGTLPTLPPKDPVIYRFQELVQVYGTTLKELINEEFGDGIMSAIDFEMQLERQPDPKGDRVKITMSGKFLPYRRY